ncbi:MAG TPA: hypothetical protein VL096_15360 [Pirellulaceae bacterium]|nr:hypothetical protein [Pirellulaceae bacterium]
MPANRYQVEFVGGPLDGHLQAITVPVHELNETATFPITRNLFRLLGRRSGGKPHPVTSVAIYQLEYSQSAQTDLQPRYRFQNAAAPVTVG